MVVSQMIHQSRTLQLPGSRSGIPTIRTKENIRKVKDCLRRNKRVSVRKVSMELGISGTTVRQILKIDLVLKPYKKVMVCWGPVHRVPRS